MKKLNQASNEINQHVSGTEEQKEPTATLQQATPNKPDIQNNSDQNSNIESQLNEHSDEASSMSEQQEQMNPSKKPKSCEDEVSAQEPSEANARLVKRDDKVSVAAEESQLSKDPSDRQIRQDEDGSKSDSGDNNLQRQKRVRRTDDIERKHVCACGKTYLSNAALFTHTKIKHNGVAPRQGDNSDAPVREKPDRHRTRHGSNMTLDHFKRDEEFTHGEKKKVNKRIPPLTEVISKDLKPLIRLIRLSKPTKQQRTIVTETVQSLLAYEFGASNQEEARVAQCNGKTVLSKLENEEASKNAIMTGTPRNPAIGDAMYEFYKEVKEYFNKVDQVSAAAPNQTAKVFLTANQDQIETQKCQTNQAENNSSEKHTYFDSDCSPKYASQGNILQEQEDKKTGETVTEGQNADEGSNTEDSDEEPMLILKLVLLLSLKGIEDEKAEQLKKVNENGQQVSQQASESSKQPHKMLANTFLEYLNGLVLRQLPRLSQSYSVAFLYVFKPRAMLLLFETFGRWLRRKCYVDSTVMVNDNYLKKLDCD